MLGLHTFSVKSDILYVQCTKALILSLDIKKRKISDELIDQELPRAGQQSTSRQTSLPDLPRNVVFDMYDFTGRPVRTCVHVWYFQA